MTRQDILDILDAFGQSHFARLELAFGSVRVAANRAPAAAAAPPLDRPRATVPVAAPGLGVFQQGPQAGAPPLVRPGAEIQPGSVVGFIRTLEDLTAVTAGLPGTVVEVAVQDGQFVEFGQTLLQVSPHAATAPQPCGGRGTTE